MEKNEHIRYELVWRKMNTIERNKMVKMSIQALINVKTATCDSPEALIGAHPR